MRGRGENPAPHFFYTRQAPPRIVGRFFCQPLIPIIPTGCAARCAGSQDFVVPSAQRCPENWTRYPLHHSDSLDPRRVMEITFEVARLGESGLANPEKK